MNVLVLNCGSSSVKFQLIDTSLEAIEDGTERTLARGLIDRIGMSDSLLSLSVDGRPDWKNGETIADHRQALRRVLEILCDAEHGAIQSLDEIGAVGHRVVHGGEKFAHSCLITPEVAEDIRGCIELAPLHNPHNLRGYLYLRELLPKVPQAAVFDTSFHHSMPAHAYLYGLPYGMYEHYGVRRYGFHGTSHRFLTYRIHRLLNVGRHDVNAITVHLGNGCSVAAVRKGDSIDTSMGFTPTEGLLMGTRTGDIDPAALLHIMGKEGMSLHEANTTINKHSGLLGVSGVSHDMRNVLKAADGGHERARIAVDIFCYRVIKTIASYLPFVADDLHGIAFTGGIGENAAAIRERVVGGLASLGIKLDAEANRAMVGGREGLITLADSRYRVFVIPTNEELVIARDTVRAIAGVL